MVMFLLLFTSRKSFQSISFSLWKRESNQGVSGVEQLWGLTLQLNCDTRNKNKKWERYALHHGLGSFLQTRRETLRRVAEAGLRQKTVSVQVAQLGLHFLTPRDEAETKTGARGGLLNGPWKRQGSH